MLSAEKNRELTEVGPGKPMGEVLRRHWHPVAGVSQFDSRATMPIRLFGEDLVLFKDLSGAFGLIERHCPHRGADLSHGMVEQCGLRCNYHGWRFGPDGACLEQPYEDTVNPQLRMRDRIKAKAYPVQAKAGMVWAYLGPQPAPLLPDWEAFSWENGFAQVVISVVPCNWLQCQENSIDPVHFEWMHENWPQRLRGEDGAYGPAHLKLAFEEFEFGFTYKRIKQDTDETHPNWTIGRVCLWPNAFFLGEHFEWRVPIDDENTLSITWKYSRVPRECEPYVQARIPTWEGPVFDENGAWITSHVMNQDFLAWAGQGRIADRTKEHLGQSDKGIIMIRRRLFEDLEAIANGADPKGIIRDAARNHRVELPMMDREATLGSHTKAEIMANPRTRLMTTSYIFQAGQPEWVRQEFAAAMQLEVNEFGGLPKGWSSTRGARTAAS